MALKPEKVLDPYLPEEQVPEYEYNEVDLAGVAWNYRLFWNNRSERWQIDLWTSDGEKAVYGEKLVPNYPIAWAHTGRNPVGGRVMLWDTGDPDAREQCTYEGLGHRWLLVWAVDDGTDVDTPRPWSITLP